MPSKGHKKIETIRDLQPDTLNANKGTPRGLQMVEDSLRTYGAGRSILADKKGRIIAGNKTLQSASDINLPIRVVETDGKELVVVQRTDLDLNTKKARELGIADNRASQVGLEWDASILAQLKDEGVELSGMFTEKELAALLPQGESKDAEPQIDKAAELQAKWGTESGQLWLVGKHRLLIGDSTDERDVGRLMAGNRAHMVFTDPPYGVNYDGGAKKREKLENDHFGTDIYARSLAHLKFAVDDNAALYLWYADGHVAAAAAAAAGYVITAQIVWLKNNAQFVTSAHYKGKHEPCFYAHRRNKTARWYGPNNEVTVWECDRAQSNDFHPTQKPVALAERAINNSSAEGDTVLDLFLGGGTTMVASENRGRVCYALELKPEYAAVTLQRMQDAFGIVGAVEREAISRAA